MQRPTIPVIATVAVLAGALGVAAAWLHAPGAATQPESGVLLDSPRPIADVTLTDQDGRPFTFAGLQGSWHLVFAGFTHCPDVCPTTLTVMRQVRDRLGPRGGGLGMVFLSLDPERDTPERMKQYLAYFDAGIVGVSGTAPELDRLCASLGIAHARVPAADGVGYTIDHSAALVLVNPQGRVAGYFPAPHDVPTLARDLERVTGGPA